MAAYPFVVLEGLSGVGKSAVAKLLAAELGGVYYHTPPDPLVSARRGVDEACRAQARYHFYLAGVIHASEEIRALTTRCAVVCDRYIATTHFWHALIGAAVLQSYEPLGLLEPALTALVTCEESERRCRLQERGRTRNDLEEARGEREAGLLAAYRRWGMLEVDNTCSVDHAVERLVALVEESSPPKLACVQAQEKSPVSMRISSPIGR
jgi:thymidylate kinase